jgi:hypothetical protein
VAPVYYIGAFGRGTVPHGGFAAVQDDITMMTSRTEVA